MKHSLLLVALLTISCLQPIVAQQQTTVVTSDGTTLWFRSTAEGAVATHAISQWPYYADNQRPRGHVTMPDSVAFEGRMLPVVEVGRNAFYDCDSMVAITVGRHVKRIATQAFNGCVALKEVALPDSLHAIGEGAFAYCRSLTHLTLPPTVDSIGMSAFSMCIALQPLSLPSTSAAHVDGTAFHGCTTIEKASAKKQD